jgi:voltage-gated potassium channel
LISVVVRAQDNENLARQAGANTVINPVHFTGLLLAGSAKGSHIADYLADLASVSGEVQLVERSALPEEVGRPLDALANGGRGLRIYRDGASIGFWEDGARAIRAGDVIVEIRPTRAAAAAA